MVMTAPEVATSKQLQRKNRHLGTEAAPDANYRRRRALRWPVPGTKRRLSGAA